MRVMRQRGRGHHMISHGIGWLVAEVVLAAVFRFFAGQVVTRRPGRYDARYTTWAVPVSEEVRNSRAEGVPRRTWSRRPGYQRQAVRLAAIAALAGLLWVPTLTVTVLAVAFAVLVAWRVTAVRTRRAYAPVIEPWAEYVAEKIGREGADPFSWIKFPNREVTWEPVEPLVWLTWERGWLTRRVPAVAAVLARAAVPIAEQPWVTRTQERAAVEGAPASTRALGRAVEVLVLVVERSRALRVWPRVVTYGLDHDDARIEIRYPARYPAHEQDLTPMKQVVCGRLEGEWQVDNHARDLRLVFRRPRRMPSTVVMSGARPVGAAAEDQGTRHLSFADFDAMHLPIGADAAGAVTIDLKGKSPHVSIAASTGWGKTVTANTCAAHLLLHGWHGLLMDPKRVGYVGAFRNASRYVELWTTLEGQIAAIEAFRDEMNRRYEFMETYFDRLEELGWPAIRDFPEQYFQPVFLMEDEKGSLTVAIKAWWKRQGGGFKEDGVTPIPGKGDPEPLLMEQEILWRGRAAAMHVITLAQQNNLNVFLNSDMRDQYMCRVLSGPTTSSAWRMTFGDGAKRRRVAAKKGRAIFGIGAEDLRELQLGMTTDAEARTCAQAGERIADKENAERAQKLATITGQPLWAVSPLPSWVGPPAQTAAGVPGHDDERDTPATAPARPLTLVGARAQESPVQDAEIVPDNITDAPGLSSAGAVGTDVRESNASSSDGGTDRPELIVGIAAGAAHLGIKEGTFKKRRDRARRDGHGIPGETTVNRSPAWPPVELSEWDNLYRSAS